MSREKFEKIVSSPPFELCTERWPNDPAKYAWPGNYKHYNLQLAYDVCMDYSKEQAEQLTAAKQRIAELEKDCDILAQNHQADRQEIERLKSALVKCVSVLSGISMSKGALISALDSAHKTLKGAE